MGPVGVAIMTGTIEAIAAEGEVEVEEVVDVTTKIEAIPGTVPATGHRSGPSTV